MPFRVQLDMFSGPLNLLWYLVRKHELDVLDIPIAKVTEQYLEMITAIEAIDVNAVGDFLEMATRLMEAKSRMILPRQEEEEEEMEDPRQDIVERLLEYKKYKDAASLLEERGQQWQRRFTRRVNDLPAEKLDPADQPIQEVEMWDLVSAFARVIRDNAAVQPTNIRYDDTPIEVYMDVIRERLATEERVAFTSLFESDMHRSKMVGIFLAILELIRHHQVQVEQEELFDEIWVLGTGPELSDESPEQEQGEIASGS